MPETMTSTSSLCLSLSASILGQTLYLSTSYIQNSSQVIKRPLHRLRQRLSLLSLCFGHHTPEVGDDLLSGRQLLP